MQWFKHDTDANQDAKLKRLRMRYGMEGYGLYWYCLEQIASKVSKHNLTFELEHDAEILAHDTGLHVDHVTEMMSYMVEIGLFELNDSLIIVCIKLLKRLDQSMTGDSEFRKKIKELQNGHGAVMISHDNDMEENKNKNKNKNKQRSVSFDEFWSAYPKKKNKGQARKAWEKLNPTPDLQTKILNQISIAKKTDGWLKDGGRFIPYPSTWINAEGWEDEPETSAGLVDDSGFAGLSKAELWIAQ